VTASIATAVLTGYLSIVAGVLLMILPWSQFWEDNRFFEYLPYLEPVLLHDVGRASVAGLGLVDLVVGIREALRMGSDADGGGRPGK
jgi:hypothetical protein